MTLRDLAQYLKLTQPMEVPGNDGNHWRLHPDGFVEQLLGPEKRPHPSRWTPAFDVNHESLRSRGFPAKAFITLPERNRDKLQKITGMGQG